MRSKCAICKLDPTKLAAIESALRSGTSLRVVAAENGCSKSGLARHAAHITTTHAAATSRQAPEPAQKAERAAPKAKPAVLAPPNQAVSAPVVQAPEPEPFDREASRRRALDRTERLWNEVNSCMEDAQKPTVIVKPDGSTLEVPMDLRTRSSVVRAGVGVVDLAAKLAGVYDNQAGPTLNSNMVIQNVILCPKLPGVEAQYARPGLEAHTKVVDVEPEPALTDGGTPDSEK